jgi:hypothetical protein
MLANGVAMLTLAVRYALQKFRKTAARLAVTSLNNRGDTDALREVRLRRTLVATSKRNKTHEHRAHRDTTG